MSSNYRDFVPPEDGSDVPLQALLPRRRIVVVVGIDDYRGLPKLRCAVSDALGVQDLLVRHFGFEAPIAPLMNQAATKQAIEALVEDHLRKLLQPDDALILFFAGHGKTRLARVGAVTVETGYIAPVEARASDMFSDLIDMGDLLRKVGMLPARHILVVLDACHSGMALGTAVSQYRSADSFAHRLAANHSRRVITSARREEVALDSGPVPGHSLFTGTLIQALTSGQADLDGNGIVTFSELALCLQQSVGQASGSRQTPDYGAFHLDDRGELILAVRDGGEHGQPVHWDAAPQGRPQPARPTRRRWRVVLGALIACAIAGLGIALGSNMLFRMPTGAARRLPLFILELPVAPNPSPPTAPSSIDPTPTPAPSDTSSSPPTAPSPITFTPVITCSPGPCDEILIDEKPVAAARLPSLEPGVHRVKVSKAGFVSQSAAFTVKSGEKFEKEFKLFPLPPPTDAERAKLQKMLSSAFAGCSKLTPKQKICLSTKEGAVACQTSVYVTAAADTGILSATVLSNDQPALKQCLVNSFQGRYFPGRQRFTEFKVFTR